MNLDASSNIHRKPEAVLLSHEREKKKKYLQGKAVTSCDGVLGNEVKGVYFKTLPRREIRKVLFRNFKLHEVKEEHCNCTRQATYLCTRGSRIPMSRMS